MLPSIFLSQAILILETRIYFVALNASATLRSKIGSLQSVYIVSALYWAFYCARKFEDLVPELRADRRSRLSNAAAAVWPTHSRKFEARDAQGLLKKYCIRFTVVQLEYI